MNRIFRSLGDWIPQGGAFVPEEARAAGMFWWIWRGAKLGLQVKMWTYILFMQVEPNIFWGPVRWLDSDKMFVLNDVKFHLRVRVEPIHTIRSVANDAFATDPAKSNKHIQTWRAGDREREREIYKHDIFSWAKQPVYTLAVGWSRLFLGQQPHHAQDRSGQLSFDEFYKATKRPWSMAYKKFEIRSILYIYHILYNSLPSCSKKDLLCWVFLKISTTSFCCRSWRCWRSGKASRRRRCKHLGDSPWQPCTMACESRVSTTMGFQWIPMDSSEV